MAPVDDVILHEEEGEAFLLHVPTGRYYGLNRTGLVVWKALAAGEDPAGALEARWPDVPADTRQADIEAIVDSLVQAGLARAAGSPPPGE